jgi:hypothetical protein
MKKPPDPYKCIKVPLHKIIRDTDHIDTIFDCVVRTNKIIIKTYQLLRLWILDKYHNDEDIPKITEKTIKTCIKAILKPSSGPKTKDNDLLDQFKSLYSFEQENGKNLSSILGYQVTSILTAFENNIKFHFFDYVRRFINSYFKDKYKDEISNSAFKKQLSQELNKVKNDIINNTDTCDDKYKEWLKDNRYNIVPKKFKKSYYYDVIVSPQKYIKHMIWMNIQLEKIGRKLFQPIPLRTDITPKFISIDTKALVEILVQKNKNYYLKDITGTKEILWDQFFNIKQKVKNYYFDHTIITDCCSASIRFIHKDQLEEVNDKKERMSNGKKGIKNDKPIKKKQRVINTVEFPYIDEVDKKVLEGKTVYVDPGKRDLFTMIDDDDNMLRYSNKRRVRETRRIRYQRLIKNYKDKCGISNLENKLSDYNSKSCNLEKYKKYLNNKNEINEKLFSLYEDKKFRQYKWYGFINRKRAEDNMLNLIEKRYGKDTKIIMGDWCISKQMRNFISTPNIGIKRKLKERFDVYNIDEFRTSCLYHKTEDKGDNLYLPDKKERLRKLHSVLTFKMENSRRGCINRDYNGCINMRKLFHSYMKDGTRPLRYQRGFELKKDTNPAVNGGVK